MKQELIRLKEFSHREKSPGIMGQSISTAVPEFEPLMAAGSDSSKASFSDPSPREQEPSISNDQIEYPVRRRRRRSSHRKPDAVRSEENELSATPSVSSSAHSKSSRLLAGKNNLLHVAADAINGHLSTIEASKSAHQAPSLREGLYETQQEKKLCHAQSSIARAESLPSPMKATHGNSRIVYHRNRSSSGAGTQRAPLPNIHPLDSLLTTVEQSFDERKELVTSRSQPSSATLKRDARKRANHAANQPQQPESDTSLNLKYQTPKTVPDDSADPDRDECGGERKLNQHARISQGPVSEISASRTNGESEARKIYHAKSTDALTHVFSSTEEMAGSCLTSNGANAFVQWGPVRPGETLIFENEVRSNPTDTKGAEQALRISLRSERDSKQDCVRPPRLPTQDWIVPASSSLRGVSGDPTTCPVPTAADGQQCLSVGKAHCLTNQPPTSTSEVAMTAKDRDYTGKQTVMDNGSTSGFLNVERCGSDFDSGSPQRQTKNVSATSSMMKAARARSNLSEASNARLQSEQEQREETNQTLSLRTEPDTILSSVGPAHSQFSTPGNSNTPPSLTNLTSAIRPRSVSRANSESEPNGSPESSVHFTADVSAGSMHVLPRNAAESSGEVLRATKRAFAGYGKYLNGKSEVETWPDGYAPGVLYLQEPDRCESRSDSRCGDLLPTHLVKIPPSVNENDVVFTDSSFTVKVTGLCFGQEDVPSGLAKITTRSKSLPSERLRVLYSVRREGSDGSPSLIPAVHHDFRRESRNSAAKQYIAIPQNRGLVTRGDGISEAPEICIRFALLQIRADYLKSKGSANGITRGMLEKTLDNIDEFTSTLNALSSSTTPYFAILAPFIKISGALGTSALENAGMHERFIDDDFSFRLVSRDETQNPRGSLYLRYGWYFILSEPCRYRLYTQLDTLEHTRLLARKVDGRFCDEATKHLTYIIVRVEEQNREKDNGKPVQDRTKRLSARGMYPPLEVRDIEVLREALSQAREAPDGEFRDRILKLLDKVNGSE